MSVLGELAAVQLEKAVAEMRALWSGLKGGARVPLRSAFGPETLKRWLPNIAIVEAVGAPPRFRVRLAGTAAVSYADRDFTDKFLDEVIPPEHYALTIAPYLQAIETGEPMEDDVHGHQFAAPDGTSLPVRRLVMPCSSDGAAIDRFVVGLFLYRPESNGS
ncbi:MAG: PAS domain-containing protein [Dongiaceae bacterium]